MRRISQLWALFSFLWIISVQPRQVFAESDVLHWFVGDGVLQDGEVGSPQSVCNQDGIMVSGAYLGKGSLVEIVGATASDVYRKVRVTKQINYGNVLPLGWRFVVSEGDTAWTYSNCLRTGTPEEYEQFIHGVKAYRPAVVQIIRFSPSTQILKDALHYWARFTEGGELIESIEKQASRRNINLTSRVGHSLEEILYLLSFVPIGRAFLDDFIPRYLKGDFTIESVRSEAAKGAPSVAEALAFYWQGHIFVDFESDLARLLPIFIHEGTHALDLAMTGKDQILFGLVDATKKHEILGKTFDELDSEGRREYSRLDHLVEQLKDQESEILLAAEHKAFRVHEKFITQLASVATPYQKAVEYFVSAGEFGVYPMNQGTFIWIMKSTYQKDPSEVDRYFEQHRWDEY